MDTIKAKVTFDEESHLAAFRLHMWHRYQIWLMLRTLLSIAVLLAGIILLVSQGPHPMPILMLMVGTFALLRPLIWKILHARNLRKLPGYGQTVVYTFNPDGMQIHGEDREGSVQWSQLLEPVTTQKGLLLYHGKKSYTWVPKRSFDSAEEMKQVADWAQQT